MSSESSRCDDARKAHVQRSGKDVIPRLIKITLSYLPPIYAVYRLISQATTRIHYMPHL